MRKALLLLVIGGILTGCALTGNSGGKKYGQVASTIPPVPANSVRLTMYRLYAYYAGGLDARVKINNVERLRLPTKSFAYIDVPPGKMNIRVTSWGSPEDFVINVDLKKGREYFFELHSYLRHDNWTPGPPGWWPKIASRAATKFYSDPTNVAVKESGATLVSSSSILTIAPVTRQRALTVLPGMRIAKR